MPEAVKILFWACLFTIFYTYAGYPLLVFLLVKFRHLILKKRNPAPESLLPVTLIVAACNEAGILKKKIGNCLALDYPADLLTLVFVTDGSSDGTDRLVAGFPGLTLLHQAERRGKTAAQNRAMTFVTTPAVIFSDANTDLNPASVRRIMAHYTDPRVGGVAGEKRIREEANPVGEGEGLYWRYESTVKQLDSDLKTTVGAAGELFSIRTHLYSPLPENTIIEDFVQSLKLCAKGYVVRYEREAYALESASLSIRDEMERKLRISAGAFQAIGMLPELFNVLRFPVVSFQFISHRVLRWTLCPLALVVLFFCTAYLSVEKAGTFFLAAFTAQVILYVAAATGWWFALRNRRLKAVYLPFYFVFMNFCVFGGFLRFLKKGQSVLWKRAKR